MNEIIKKAINFDLDTKALKKYYCKSNYPLEYLKAYKEIKQFMKENGFSHRQWSGYVSDEALSKFQVLRLVHKMTNQFTWFANCVNRFDVTDIGKQYDLTEYIKKYDGEARAERNVSAKLSDNIHSIEREQANFSEDKNLTKTGSKDEYAVLIKQYNELRQEYDFLNKKYSDLAEAYNTLFKAAAKQTNTINTVNLVLNEHPKVKEDFIKAKAETLQRKAEKSEKEKGGLNDTKSEIKISEHKKKSHKPKL